MPRDNSSGRSSGAGRRGGSRSNSGSSSGRGGNSDKPFNGSGKGGARGGKSSFGGSRDGGNRSDKPFKKSDKPYGRRSDDSTGSSKGSYGNKRYGSSSERPRKSDSDKPYGKRDEGSSSGSSRGSSRSSFENKRSGSSSGRPRRSDSEKPFKKFDKPYGKRDEGSSDSRERKSSRGSFDNKRSSSDRPRRSDSEKPFKKFDKPYGKRDERSSDSRERRSSRGSFDNKRSSSDRPRRSDSEKPFKKFDKPYGKKNEGSSDSRERRPRTDKPFKKSFDKQDGDAAPRRRSVDNDHESPRERKYFGSKRQDSSGAEPSREGGETSAQSEKIRLNRFIANSGVCSRREADELITMGLISVNGVTVTELGFKVNLTDEVRYENRVLRAEKPVYILLNKPKGYITTTDDPQERKTVMHIIGSAVKERIYPVGRLDRNTTGLLLLTNDGELADKLMHPSYNVKKIYKVELDRPLSKGDLQLILDGVRLEEGKAMVDDLAILDDGKTIGLELHIGWNRVVRRIFESLNYEVMKLDRSVYAGLDKKDLSRGQWRFLTKEEVIRLKHYK